MNRKVDYYKTLLDNDMDGANPALYKDENDQKPLTFVIDLHGIMKAGVSNE